MMNAKLDKIEDVNISSNYIFFGFLRKQKPFFPLSVLKVHSRFSSLNTYWVVLGVNE